MRLTSRMRGFLLNLIKAGSTKQIKRAEWALNIIDRGKITESELKHLEYMGYKQQIVS